MDEFTIYCTEAQTKKAIELGAPIKNDVKYMRGHFSNECVFEDGNLFIYKPTSEQMIGWLRKEHGIHPCINCAGSENYTVQLQFIHSSKDIDVENPNYKCIIGYKGYPSTPEATLAAIDAALEYLTNNKK